MSEIQLVKMTRTEPMFPNGPTTADVHPDSVDEMNRQGWRVAAESSSEGEGEDRGGIITGDRASEGASKEGRKRN